MTDPRTYTLEKISDLLAIPPDRLGECLRDLDMALAAARIVIAAHVATGEPVPTMSAILWTGDGRWGAAVDIGGGAHLVISAVAEEAAGP